MFVYRGVRKMKKQTVEEAAEDNEGRSEKNAFLRGASWQRANYPTCESCKHWQRLLGGPFYCEHEESGCYERTTDRTFGCNLHEPKERE